VRQEQGVIRVEFRGSPEEVVVNDGSVPESDMTNNTFKIETADREIVSGSTWYGEAVLGLHPVSWRRRHSHRLEASDQHVRQSFAGNSGLQVLVDCGLFQGPKEWRERNWRDTPVPAKEIDAVILTHAHLDHCGWIPRLVKEGFRGAIYATPPTIDLCGIILPDSGHLQEEDARFYNKTKKSKHDPALPLYTRSRKRRNRCSISSPSM
jgi:hypothetical protein